MHEGTTDSDLIFLVWDSIFITNKYRTAHYWEIRDLLPPTNRSPPTGISQSGCKSYCHFNVIPRLTKHHWAIPKNPCLLSHSNPLECVNQLSKSGVEFGQATTVSYTFRCQISRECIHSCFLKLSTYPCSFAISEMTSYITCKSKLIISHRSAQTNRYPYPVIIDTILWWTCNLLPCVESGLMQIDLGCGECRCAHPNQFHLKLSKLLHIKWTSNNLNHTLFAFKSILGEVRKKHDANVILDFLRSM